MRDKRILSVLFSGGSGSPADVNIVPSDIASLVFWIEADYGTYQDSGATTPAVANNDPVYRVNEQKNGYNPVTTNNNYRPLLTLNALNGKPTLVFDGVDDGMRVDFTRAVPETIFIVCKELSTDGATRALMSTYTFANATHDFIPPATANQLNIGSDVKRIMANRYSENYYVWSFVENNTASRIHRNGWKQATGDTGAVNSDGISIACLGNWLAAGSLQGYCHNVSIAAILIYDGILTPSEHNQVGKYLADKYGLTFHLSIDTLSDNSATTILLNRAGSSYVGEKYARPSPNSRAIYQTTATRMYLEIYNNAHASFAGFDGIGVRVDGADYEVVMPGADGTVYKTVTLPPGDKTVEVINGFQHASDTNSPTGVYALGVSFNAAWSVVTGATTPRMLVYGDSIAVGARATNLPLGGWVQILKNAHGGTVINESWSGRSFWDDCSTAGKRTTFAAQIAADTPDTILLTIGCNDRNLFGVGFWVNEADFAAAYGDFLDKLHTALPSAVIYAQTPIITEAEAAGIISVRAAITTAQSSRSAFVTLVDGLSIMDASKLDDELHPTTEGQAIYGAFMIDLLGL